MKNKQIFIMLLIVFILYIIPISVYADNEYSNDELDYSIGINALDSDDNIKDRYISYYRGYLTTYMNNRGYIWACCIKSDATIKLLYCTDEPIEPIGDGYKYSVASDSGIDDLINKPNFDNADTQWFIYPLCSPKLISNLSFDKGVEHYEYKVDINSTLPVYYKTFENSKDYDDWYNNETFNLKNNPNQDYGTHGFNPKGDYDNAEDYDLEVPLKIKCKGFDMATVGVTNGLLALRPYFTWTQSDNIDVQDWYTESYVRIVGKNRKYPWNSWADFDTGFVKDYGLFAEVPNYKRKISYKGDDWDTSCLKPVGEEARKGTSIIERYYVRARNYWFDENTKRMHYSNWVTWYIDKDGKMHCVENKDHDVTNTDDDGNVIIDSNNYNPTEDYEEKNKGKDTVSSISLDSFLDSLKQAISTIGDIPDMLGAVFSWLPPIFISIIVTGIGLLILLRILGR